MAFHYGFLLCPLLVIVVQCSISVNVDPRLKYIKMDQTYVDHGFQSLFAGSAMECCVTCTADTRCASVSFESQSNTCQLNDRNPYGDLGISVVSALTWVSFKVHPCGSPWLLFEGRCYLVVTEAKTWTDAESFCQTLDSHLADISNMDENRFVTNAVNWAKGEAVKFWIGLNDRGIDGYFIYTSGASVSYLRFAPLQPSFYYGIEREDCVHINSSGNWNDARCSLMKASVCEKIYI